MPESITADQGLVFVGSETLSFAESRGIKILNSTPYYAQADGQAEVTNKTVINIIEKMIKENPMSWDTVLSEALWAYRMSKRSSTWVTPFLLTYGQDVMLPMEVLVRLARRALQNYLEPANYNEAMITRLEELDEVRLSALDCLVVQKNRVVRSYDKKVKAKSFCVGDLVWKTILPIANWEGPFIIEQVLRGGAYHLCDIDGTSHARSINGQYLKKYYPILWKTTQLK